ncbi:putative zinc finger domain-containing MIZ-type [Rosellinia necatrix]|uniref:Putative zinc finger domain-containing MIZ-type n=1 Tax=Rosellinia necatrix TaxID=77044 RepID=A0A1W2TJW6_ROSNE|nr:putative zinc finger domain-containing MIZ-type [Rosellinia necatrix]
MATSNNEIRQLERTLGTMLNKQLQQLCSTYFLKTSGVKAELQGRLRNALIEAYTKDPSRFRDMQSTIQRGYRGSSGHTPPSMPSSSSNGGAPSYSNGNSNNPASGKGSSYTTPPAYQFTGTNHAPQPLSNFGTSSMAGSSTLSYYKNAYSASRGLHFKPSPFYTISSMIGDIHPCDVMTQHRNTIPLSIRANEHPSLANLANDKSYRVMLFCAADNSGMQDIAFPHQSEFKVNGGEIKANLRGLKGKPGTTRPVDITDSLRLKPANYNNNVEFTYALTNKKFYLAAYICQMVSVDELVTKVKGKKIAKNTVIQEMTKKANDPDVVATSTVLSLKCPLSYMRLRTPCRSILCNHIQCFDASSYLLLQEQGPQWICPICNQPAPFENLAIDEYARDILDKTADSVDQVTIEPDGRWTTQLNEAAPKKSRVSSANTNIDIDDDISVVTDNATYSTGGYGGTPQPFSTPNRTFGGRTPSSREPSGAPRSGSKKRPAAEVIDLTLSSDEDDVPITRPLKKQNMGHGHNGSNDSFHIGSIRHY